MGQCIRLCLVGGVVLAMVVAVGAPLRAQINSGPGSSGLISREQARNAGLDREWFARAQVNPARSKVVRWILAGNQILLVTNAGLIQAIDADTGQTLWATPVGNPEFPTLGPATNDNLAAIINGSKMYLVNRSDGRIKGERTLGGAPSAGPAMSKEFAFVPLLNGSVEGQPLDKPVLYPWFYQSYGVSQAAPVAAPHSVAWATDAGYLYVASTVGRPMIRFRIKTANEFLAKPAYHAPLFYAVSMAGDVYAFDENSGQLRWKYATGFSTVRAPAIVDDTLYVSSDEPMLHAVDARTGVGKWMAPGISQFAAVSKSHVFGLDKFGTIHVLDKASGTSVGRIPSGGTLTALVNDQTDRLFVMSDSGMIQCLHEIGATQTTSYAEQPAAEEKPTKQDGETKPEAYHSEEQPAEKQPAPRPAPQSPKPPASDDANPFGTPAAEPAAPVESTPSSDNPFG